MPLGTSGHHRDVDADLLLQQQHIVLGFLGQILPAGDAPDVGFPALEGGVNGLARRSSGVTGKSLVMVPSMS